MSLSNGKAQPAGRSVLLVRILVSVATAGVTYLIGAVARQPPAQTLMLSVFIAGVVLVVQLLADFESSVTTVQDGQQQLTLEVRDLVAQKFSAVSDATELFGRVETSALRDDVVRLARSSLRIGTPEPLLLDLARAQLDRVSHLLEQLGSGSEVGYDGEDRDWLLALTYNVRSTLDATSRGTATPDGRFVDEGLWRTELGQRYLETQGRALRNGVRIRRVFILDRAELVNDPAFREICDEQREMGIEVHVVVQRRARGAGLAFVSDFILFDDVVSYESKLALHHAQQGHPMFVGTTLVLDPVRIAQQRQRFNELWASPNELGSDA
jgi:hypothetical protein